MESLMPILILLGLVIGFLIFLLLGRKNLAEPRTIEHPSQKMIRHARQPEPLPEDPAVPQKLLRVLEENEISFEKFGKVNRIYGQLVYGIRTSPGQETDTWEKLVEVLPEQGFWPVFADPDAFRFSEEPPEMGTNIDIPPEDHIRWAQKYPFENFLMKIEDWLADRLDMIAKGEYWGTAKVPDPESVPPKSSQVPPSGLIAFLPTPHSWQVPAFFLLDSLSLSMTETLAVLRHWEDMYGAKVNYFSPNAMKLVVDRRPETKEEALQLAYEHMDVCGDLFKSMYTTPEELAADLMRRTDWEFLWG